MEWKNKWIYKRKLNYIYIYRYIIIIFFFFIIIIVVIAIVIVIVLLLIIIIINASNAIINPPPIFDGWSHPWKSPGGCRSLQAETAAPTPALLREREAAPKPWHGGSMDCWLNVVPNWWIYQQTSWYNGDICWVMGYKLRGYIYIYILI